MMLNADSIETYVEQWLLREPGMRLAIGFLPVQQREQWKAWGAFLHQLRESMFELSELSIRQAKTAWWAEECWGKARGLSRHPISKQLPESKQWSDIAQALSKTLHTLDDASDLQQQLNALSPLAYAVTSIESEWAAQTADKEAAQSLSLHWMLSRLPIGRLREDRSGIELQLLAKHAKTDIQSEGALSSGLIKEWAARLQQVRPVNLHTNRFRQQRHALDGMLLQRLVAGRGYQEPSGLATLITLWNAARKAHA